MLMMITALGAGAIFGTGLTLAGMLNPAKVVGFLDIFGMWDPSLGLVMAGGILVTGTGYYFVIKRNRPVFDARFDLPSSNNLDRPLLIGSAIFGIGWGLSGFCPGPALVSLIYGYKTTFIFCIAMIAGMFGATLFKPKPHP